MKDNEKKLFNKSAREIISNKQYTDESILEYIRSQNRNYKDERIIPTYPISPEEWFNRVSFSSDYKYMIDDKYYEDLINSDVVIMTGATQYTKQCDVKKLEKQCERIYNDWVNKLLEDDI
mgnify:CR=1 FL=1